MSPYLGFLHSWNQSLDLWGRDRGSERENLCNSSCHLKVWKFKMVTLLLLILQGGLVFEDFKIPVGGDPELESLPLDFFHHFRILGWTWKHNDTFIENFSLG